MSNIKISIFQKNINKELTKEQKSKIASQKSDFLLFPKNFPFSDGWSSNQEEKEKKYIDQLLEVSEYHKGVIIGGSIFRKKDNNWIESVPIVQDLNFIDYYDISSDSSIGNIMIKGIESESIFILGGVRFAILAGNDVFNKSHLEKISGEKIELVFNPISLIVNNENTLPYQDDLDKYADLCKEYKLHIIRSCAIGSFGEIEFLGRSFYASETGIKWKVAESESKSEILKTVNVSLLENLPF
ncbi:MAG: amidohydrolase [Leptospiraceae bacterium]|nr:amidohydrolase [Leptospiraceae bacterium]